jgi:Concanavalin A-like lectin/glucanases superfamily/Domain of unknown function (DUF2341)
MLVCLSKAAFAASWYADTSNPNLVWLYRQSITINSGSVDAVLSNFPVLISINDSTNKLFSNAASSAGNDIVFTSSDGASKISHEVEEYNSTSGSLCAWVLAPSVSNSANTTLYMYYGCSGAAAQGTNNIWTKKYLGVWHLSNVATIASDSTTNTCSMGAHGLGGVRGIIGPCASFDGVATDFCSIETGTTKNSLYNIATGESITISCWVKVAGFETGWQSLFCKGNASWRILRDNATSACAFAITGAITNTNLEGKANINDGKWHYLAAVYDAAGKMAYLYNNGILDVSTAAAGTAANTTDIAGIGQNFPQINGYWHGLIDEARFITTPEASTWISTEYHNQAFPTSFFSIGAQELRPSSSLVFYDDKKQLVYDDGKKHGGWKPSG